MTPKVKIKDPKTLKKHPKMILTNKSTNQINRGWIKKEKMATMTIPKQKHQKLNTKRLKQVVETCCQEPQKTKTNLPQTDQ